MLEWKFSQPGAGPDVVRGQALAETDG
jgi:hypothetical protein